MSKKIKATLSESEVIINTSKASLNKMLPFIMGSVISSAKFVATEIPSMGNKKKIDRGLLEIYLCLTNKRFMIWKTTWYGTPKELWVSIELDQIEDVSLKFTKVFWKLPTVKVKLISGEKIGFWSAKVFKKRTVELINNLNTKVSQSV